MAGAACPVAKHGNRNLYRQKSGTADALGELGFNVMVGVEVVENALRNIGIAFMMAPIHHPAIAHVMPTRAELGNSYNFQHIRPTH